METTLVSLQGKGSNPKTTLYVGGLDENVNEATLRAAFLPFGDVKDVSVPIDHATGKHRGFGFIQFEEREDAEAAIDNMHNAGKASACTYSILLSIIEHYKIKQKNIFTVHTAFSTKFSPKTTTTFCSIFRIIRSCPASKLRPTHQNQRRRQGLGLTSRLGRCR